MFKCDAGGVVVRTPDQEQLCEKNLGQMKKCNIDKLRLANAAVTPLPPTPQVLHNNKVILALLGSKNA